MSKTDTIELLQECDSGTKMAVASFNEVLGRVCDKELKELLTESKNHHEKLGNELHELLNKHQSEGMEPTPIASAMSFIKTNVMMTMDRSDATIADLITDGCNMGIKSLSMYLNKYESADESSKELCRRLIAIEDTLVHDLRKYL